MPEFTQEDIDNLLDSYDELSDEIEIIIKKFKEEAIKWKNILNAVYTVK